MNKRKIIFIILGIVFVILISLGIAYHFRNRRAYELDIPQVEEVTTITIEQNDEGIMIADSDEIKEIRDILYGVKRISEKESVQDYPTNIDNLIQIDFYVGETNSSTIFLYKKNNKYYIEQPYNGIYIISGDEYNSIEEYLK